jgi:hypothetical protein
MYVSLLFETTNAICFRLIFWVTGVGHAGDERPTDGAIRLDKDWLTVSVGPFPAK